MTHPNLIKNYFIGNLLTNSFLMNKFGVLLLLLVTVLGEFGKKCEVMFERKNSTLDFEITSLTRYGFASFVFSNSSTFNNSLEFIFWIDDKNEKFFLFTQQDHFAFNLTRDFRYNFKNQVIFKGITYYLTLNSSLVPFKEDKLFVRFGGSSFNQPKFEHNKSLEFQEQIEVNSQKIVPKLYSSSLRVEFFSIPSSFVYFGFFIVHWILMILFSKQQPLKSRGIIPFLALIMYNYQLIHLIENFLTMEQIYFYTIYASIINYPFLICTVYIWGINYFRYVMIFYLNNRKLTVVEKKSQNTSKAFLILLKYINHWSFTVVFMFIFILILNGIFFLFALNIPGFLNFYLAYFMYFILFLILLTVFIFDLSTNINWKQKNCIKEDIYYFRFECLFGLLIVVPTVLVFAILSLILDVGTFYVFFSIYNSILFEIGFLFQTAITLYITIISYIFKCFRKRERKDEATNNLSLLLNDQEGRELFKKYTKSEFSIENFSCYSDIIIFKKETNLSILKEQGERIYSLYLNGRGSELEVNVTRSKCIEVFKKLQMNEISRDMFDDIEKGVFENLMDTYSRFIFSSEYLIWKSKLKYLKESGF